MVSPDRLKRDLLCASIALSGILFNTSSIGADGIQPVTTAAGTNIAGAGGSFVPVLTGDGRYVAFVSHANNLVTNDDPGVYLDVFVTDLLTGTTRLASVAASGQGGGTGNSHYPLISSNGRFVVFASEADDLVANDHNDISDVFGRDLVSGTTELVSTGSNGLSATGPSIAAVISGSSRPAITPDPRWVVFESSATNLVADDTNGIPDIFVRDRQTQTTSIVSAGAVSPFTNSPTGQIRSHAASLNTTS